MVERWNPYEIQLSCFMVLAVLSEIRECDSLNPEGLALLEFRGTIEDDPYGAFSNWNSNHSEPCLWLGVRCVDGKVHVLNLSGFSLNGTLAPGLRKLRYMRSLVLSNNHLWGSIPDEIGDLKLLELLDLRHNNLSGTIPMEIGGMPSLKCLLLCGNNFVGYYPPKVVKLESPRESQYDGNRKSDVRTANGYVHRSTGQSIWQHISHRSCMCFRVSAFVRSKFTSDCLYNVADNCWRYASPEDAVHRHLLAESRNLPAAPAHASNPWKQDSPIALRSSGTFPATRKPLTPSQIPSPQESQLPYRSFRTACMIVGLSVILLGASILGFFCIRRKQKSKKTVCNQDSALLHRLSKAFVTGVPKLNSSELETACEDFSNIIDTFSGCLMYKGTLSSGVEIAVLSTSIRSSKQWSNHAEKEFKRKIDSLSRINHKNFVSLLGYCEEEDPFVRMMVFEYTPNGNLYEHLHVKDAEHLDWTTRMRIIMGICYCLEHMHHEVHPPIVHPNLQSDLILLTDDYAAKIADISFWADIVAKAKLSDGEESEPLNSDPGPSLEDNVFSLGILLLEIISSKSLTKQAKECLSDKEKYSSLVDPTLKSFRNNDLEIVCEVVCHCINDDPRQRPTMKEVTSKLREVINISPEAATARFSPLWWAELEILPSEST